MNRNIIYLVVGALAVVVIVLGVQLRQEKEKTSGVDIDVTKHGLSIEHKSP